MLYESKQNALEDLSRKCIASQCEPPSVGIGIDNVGAHFRDGTWQEIGGLDVMEGIYIAQCTQYLHGVHQFLKAVVTWRPQLMRTEL